MVKKVDFWVQIFTENLKQFSKILGIDSRILQTYFEPKLWDVSKLIDCFLEFQ